MPSVPQGVTHPGTATGTLDNSGAGVVRISSPPTGIVWRIHQMAVSMNPSGLMVVVGTLSGLPCLTSVLISSGGAADGTPPIDVGSHDEMALTITEGVPNASIVVAYYYEELTG